jgi:C1A family cysteine protease
MNTTNPKPFVQATLFKPKMKPSELPESYSLVDDGNVWQVKNQLSCGSCWVSVSSQRR